MTKEQFENKYVGKAVHCDTEEKAKELLTLAHSFGWKWNSGQSLIEDTYLFFIKEYNYYVFDFDKTTLRSSYKFYKSKGYEIVKFESEEKKVKKTKIVFDLGLYVEWAIGNEYSQEEILDSIKGWALESHGKTAEEMSKIILKTRDIWMKEVEVEYELTEREIESLKALKVLGFSWIARDKDGDLHAFYSEPMKFISSYGAEEPFCHLEKDLFSFITWQDEEPTSIDELLKHA